MRVNIYAEEMTELVEVIEKTIEGEGTFTGLRIYLQLPVAVQIPNRNAPNNMLPSPADANTTSERLAHIKGPFIHRPGDDDSSAVTFWGKRDLIIVLEKALMKLKEHYNKQAQVSAGDTADRAPAYNELTVNRPKEINFPEFVGSMHDAARKPCFFGHEPNKSGLNCAKCGCDLLDQAAGLKLS